MLESPAMNSMHTLIVEKVYTKPSVSSEERTFRPDIKWVMDFKKISLNKSFLDLFSDGFKKLVLSSLNFPIQIAGMESGALPLLTTLSLQHTEKIINSFYIRKSRKKNDLTKQVEGTCLPNVPIILVDDILNSGSTMRKQIEILRAEGHTNIGIFSIIRYRDIGYYHELFGENITIFSMFELNDFTNELGIQNLIQKKGFDVNLLKKYTPTWKVVLGKANHYDVIPKSAPVCDNDTLYLGSDEGSLFALNKKTGDKIWEFKTLYTAQQKGIYSSPMLYEGSIYFGAYDGNVYCLNKETGKRIWVFLDADYVGSSPCVAEDLGLVFIGLEFGLFNKKGGVVALDAKTGKAIWIDKGISDFVHASPEYNKKHNLVVCGANNGYFYAFDATTGERKWEFETEGEIKYGATFDDSRNLVFVGSFDGGLYAINVKDGTLYHRFGAQAGFFSKPIIYKQFVIIGSLDRAIYAYNVEKKEIAWKYETLGRVFSSPVIHENLLYIGSNDGCEYVFDAMTGEKYAQIQLTERIVNKVCVDKTSVFIPTHAGEVYRYDKVINTLS